MNRFTGLVSVIVLGFTMAWAQAPAQQGAPGAAPGQANPGQVPTPQSAPTPPAAITGCMTQWFGNFSVNDPSTSKSWEIKGNGASFWNDENHVVRVQGLPDPKAPKPTIYAQSVQDTGQACGTAAASNAGTAQPGATEAAGQPATGTTTGTAEPGATGSGATSETPNSNATDTQPRQTPGGGVARPSSPSAAPQSAAPQQGGVSGTAAASPMTSQTSTAKEDKGVPSAGTPQNAGTSVATNSAQQQAADDMQVFTGCVTGTVNNYQFKANDGKAYHLQGNTYPLKSMVNHQVELTGEDFNGKAIQVNGARDLGGNCKGK